VSRFIPVSEVLEEVELEATEYFAAKREGRRASTMTMGFVCEECGREFDREHGLRVHQRRSHRGAAEPAEPRPLFGGLVVRSAVMPLASLVGHAIETPYGRMRIVAVDVDSSAVHLEVE
jgi:hypothetical protein